MFLHWRFLCVYVGKEEIHICEYISLCALPMHLEAWIYNKAPTSTAVWMFEWNSLWCWQNASGPVPSKGLTPQPWIPRDAPPILEHLKDIYPINYNNKIEKSLSDIRFTEYFRTYISYISVLQLRLSPSFRPSFIEPWVIWIVMQEAGPN